eukprot:TRINITY_DN2576_c1_g1_i1.p1 TRINITY_DN2576_c1_g1~~TRINITY_DN2576_c1_g1_i1.p1  ORF type:complete len:576 (+),score=114.39 TRINITY_DN2576_c1_g1_i1:189-1916(+)
MTLPSFAFAMATRENTENTEREDETWFRIASDEGHIEATRRLGEIYSESQDTEKARGYFTKAAERGDHAAILKLASMLEEGQVEEDIHEAKRWYKKIAHQNPSASFALGMLSLRAHERSSLVADLQEANEWFQIAADLGHLPSALILGAAYSNGTGVPQDLDRSERYLKTFIESGLEDPTAYLHLGQVYLRKATQSNDAQTSYNFHQLALQNLRTAVDNGSAEACTWLGIIMNASESGAEEAKFWFRKAAGRDTFALYCLAKIMMEEGDKFEESLALMKQAANRGNREAKVYLGDLLATGDADAQKMAKEFLEEVLEEGDDPEIKRKLGAILIQSGAEEEKNRGIKLLEDLREDPAALYVLGMAGIQGKYPCNPEELLTKAATKGDAPSCVALMDIYKNSPEKLIDFVEKLVEKKVPEGYCLKGYMKAQGIAYKKDKTEAPKWYRLASVHGHKAAPYFLGQMYLRGDGVQRNLMEAKKFFEIGITRQESRAMHGLACVYLFEEETKNVVEGERWLRRASRMGYSYSTYLLGNLRYFGKVLEQDKAEGLAALRAAADAGIDEAVELLGRIEKGELT